MKRINEITTRTTILSSSEEDVDSPLYSDDPKVPKFDDRVVKSQPKPVPLEDYTKVCCCRMPIGISMEPKKKIVESHSGLSLIRVNSREWKAGTELTYSFIEDWPFKGDDEVIIQAFEEWSKICNVKFRRLNDGDMSAKIRIGFDEKDGCWSYIGQNILKTEYDKKKTMNFDCALYYRRNVALHEIGHTLGFPHEHQNNKSGIKWNVQAVYDFYKALGWNEETIDHNILKIYEGVHGYEWDPESIMNYDFGPNLILEPEKYRLGIKRPDTFSKLDIKLARKFYPFPVGVQPISEEKRILSIDEKHGGTKKVSLRKGEPKIISLQFGSLVSDFEVHVMRKDVDILLKDGTKVLASGSIGKPIEFKRCDIESNWVVEACLQSHSMHNELPVTITVIIP